MVAPDAQVTLGDLAGLCLSYAGENNEITGSVIQRIWIPAVRFAVSVHRTMVVKITALIAPDAVPAYVAVQDDHRGEKCGDSF